MQLRTLAGTDIRTSPVGFGCAGLMRTTSEKQRHDVLAAAYAAGVRHFDVAPMYGLGQVERIVGDFLVGRRDQVTITTKFGISLNAMATKLATVQSIVRRIIAIHPALREFVKRRQQGLYQSSNFSADEARRSLEGSLASLKTDYVDILLLHECTIDSIQIDEVMGFLSDALSAGKIRAFGIATGFDRTVPILERYPQLCPIVEFDSDIVNGNLEKISTDNRAAITHSALSKALDTIMSLAESSPSLASSLSETIGADCRSRSVLSEVLLGYAAMSNPEGITLFQSSKADHIEKNVQAIVNRRYSDEALVAFSKAVRSAAGATTPELQVK